jgi:hypothetical protein
MPHYNAGTSLLSVTNEHGGHSCPLVLTLIFEVKIKTNTNGGGQECPPCVHSHGYEAGPQPGWLIGAVVKAKSTRPSR